MFLPVLGRICLRIPHQQTYASRRTCTELLLQVTEEKAHGE